MIKTSQLIVATCLMAGSLAAGTARAHGGADVQWTVSVGTPLAAVLFGQPWPGHSSIDRGPVFYGIGPQVHRAPPPPRHGWHAPRRWDIDGDGIPNRYDRVYNPRWDRDGDGIPNRYDRVHNPRWDRDADRHAGRRDGRWSDRRGGHAPDWQGPVDRP